MDIQQMIDDVAAAAEADRANFLQAAKIEDTAARIGTLMRNCCYLFKPTDDQAAYLGALVQAVVRRLLVAEFGGTHE